VADVVTEHVALLQGLIGRGIPARTAVEAVEAELFGAPAGAGAPSIVERVLDRALPTNNGRGGPADVGCAGGRVPCGGPATARGDQDAAERWDGQDVSRRRLLPGSQDGPSERLAATDSAIVGADAVQPGVIVVDDEPPLLLGGHQGESAPLTVADSAGGVADAVEAGIIVVGDDSPLPVAAVPAAEQGAVDGDVAVVDHDARPAVEEALSAVVVDAAVPSRVGTHQQTAEDLLRASPFGGTAGSLPSRAGGMALASQPIALTYPLPPSSTGPLASEVFLVVDDRETTGSGVSRSAFLSRLRMNPGLTGRVVTRRLPCGDATLVARVTTAGAGAFAGSPAAGTGLILDQIIERKTAADLVSSMRDGRLAEQSYWMLASRRSSLTFLIEGSVEAATRGDAAMRRDAGAFLASLSVENNIFVKETDNMSETVQYYASMTRHRSRRLGTADGLAAWLERNRVADGASPGSNDVLTYSKWDEYMKELRGVATLQQLWSLQLSVLPGIGPVRIDVIMAAGYKTPKALALVYSSLSEADGRELLAKLPPLPGGHHITTKVSEYVHSLFTDELYGPRA